jgi:HPt (histidine-containing phosphotransfer) domain-containing protein
VRRELGALGLQAIAQLEAIAEQLDDSPGQQALADMILELAATL